MYALVVLLKQLTKVTQVMTTPHAAGKKAPVRIANQQQNVSGLLLFSRIRYSSYI